MKTNKIVWDWFVSVRAKNLNISGLMIQEQATEMAKALGKIEFETSSA